MNWKQLTTTLMAMAVLTCSSFAFIEADKNNIQLPPQTAVGTLEDQQTSNGIAPVVGSEDPVGKQTVIELEGKDTEAMRKIQQDIKPDGTKILQQVEVESQVSKGEPIKKVVFGILFLVFGVIVVFAFRFYADRAVPAMPQNRQVKW